MEKKRKIMLEKPRAPRALRLRRLKSGAKTAVVAAALTLAYFGVIALLMMPAFDVA